LKSFALNFNSLRPDELPTQTAMTQAAEDLAVKTTPLGNAHGTVVLAPSVHPEEDIAEKNSSSDTPDASDDQPFPSPAPGPAPTYFQSWQVNMIDIKIDYSPDQVSLLPPSPVTLFSSDLSAVGSPGFAVG
jgi:hypothetical protein